MVVKEKKEDEVKPVEKPAEKPEEKKVEPKVEKKPVEEKPKVNPDAVYKPKAAQSTSDNKTTDTKAGTPGSHGDDAGKTGDKGSPEAATLAQAFPSLKASRSPRRPRRLAVEDPDAERADGDEDPRGISKRGRCRRPPPPRPGACRVDDPLARLLEDRASGFS